MKDPFISVVIPTYNRQNLLKDAIASVLNQTYSSLEVLVIDDYSKEDIKKVVNNIDDSRVNYFLNKRKKGAQGSRNTGILKASGEWIAFLDSDDIWHPEKLSTQICHINNNLEGCICISVENTELQLHNELNKSKTVKYFNTYELLHKNDFGGFSSILCLKEALYEIGFLDESFKAMQDRELYVRLSKLGKLAKIDSILVKLNVSNMDRITRNYSNKLESAELFYKKFEDDINRSWILKNGAFSRIYFYSALSKDFLKASKYFPWAIFGLILDFHNTLFYHRNVLSYFVHNNFFIRRGY